MRLRVSVFVLLAAALWLTGSAYAEKITSYPVGNLGLTVVEDGGLVIDKSGFIWFAAEFTPAVPVRPALCYLDPVKKRVISYRLPTVIDYVGALAYDAKRNIIWLVDSAGQTLSKFQITTRKLTVYYLPILHGDMPDIQSIAVDEDGHVFCALYVSEAIGIFNPAAPTTLAMYSTEEADDPFDDIIEPYSIVVEADGLTAWFTGDGDWVFGNLDLTDPLAADLNTWAASDPTDIETYCLRWDPTVGTEGRLFMTGFNTADDPAAEAIGKFDPTVTDALETYEVCAEDAGLYGLDLELGAEEVWVAESEDPGAAAEVDASGDGENVDLTMTTTEDVAPTNPSVPRPKIYQLSAKTCPLKPNIYNVADRCEEDGDTEEFPISPTSQPAAVAIRPIGLTGYAVWMNDTYDDTIVMVEEIEL